MLLLKGDYEVVVPQTNEKISTPNTVLHPFQFEKKEKAPTKKWKSVEQAELLGRKTQECLMDRSIFVVVFCS